MKLLLFILLSINSLYALNTKQLEVYKIAKKIGEKTCYKEMCFGKTLPRIAYVESYFGKYLIGDSKEIGYYYIHNNKKVFVDKKSTFKENKLRYAYYQPNEKEKYIKKVYKKTTFKPLEESSLGVFQIKLSTAKETIRKSKLKEYYYLLNNDSLLVTELLGNVIFSATVAVNYLKLNYQEAYNHRSRFEAMGVRPWELSVSRYNGGNRNWKYIGWVKKRMRDLKKI